MNKIPKKERLVMNIKPYDKSIKELLLSGNQYIVPRFQREYSWDKKNYSEFLDDILKCLEIIDGKIIVSQYFIGTMLFVGDEKQTTQQKMDVVDGQQRLTTITVLFSTLSDIFLEIEEKILSDQIFKYIMTTDDDGEPVRILKSKTHYPFFADYIQTQKKEEVQSASSEEEQCIKSTYEFFKEKLEEENLRKLIEKHFHENIIQQCAYVDILKAIRDQVLKCIFVAIYTKNRKHANMIFEILNAKGKKLSSIDLIKNRIFEVLDKEEPSDFADITWSGIKDILNEENCDIGFVTFYRHFWLSRYKRTSESKLYDEFISCIRKSEKDYIEFLKQLKEDANLYIQIIKPERSHYDNKKEYYPVVQSLNALSNYFNIIQTRIVILALMNVKAKKLISLTELKKCLVYMENFHFSYNAIGSLAANRIEPIYTKYAILLNKATTKQEVNKCVDELKERLSDIYIPYSDFQEKFIALSFSKKNVTSNIKAKYAIQKLNMYYQGKEIYDDELSIEHIASENENKENTNIGNLIALEVSLNQDARDLSYTEKKDIYRKSKYTCMQKFIDKYEVWDESKFNERAIALSEVYYTKILERSR